MMAPDYAHWHGMSEVAERFYQKLIPQALELADRAEKAGRTEAGEAVRMTIEEILARPEHQWFRANRQAAAKPVDDEPADASN